MANLQEKLLHFTGALSCRCFTRHHLLVGDRSHRKRQAGRSFVWLSAGSHSSWSASETWDDQRRFVQHKCQWVKAFMLYALMILSPFLVLGVVLNIQRERHHVLLNADNCLSLCRFCSQRVLWRLSTWEYGLPKEWVVDTATNKSYSKLLPSQCVAFVTAGIVRDLAAGVAEYCPKALVAIISNPVNSTVPIAAEVFKRSVFQAYLPANLHSRPLFFQQYYALSHCIWFACWEAISS